MTNPPPTTSTAAGRNSRIGVVLFVIYLAFYAGFVLLAALSPATMERTPYGGVNLAIWYGFALIVAAFALALVYGLLCRAGDADDLRAPGSGRPGSLSVPNQKS